MDFKNVKFTAQLRYNTSVMCDLPIPLNGTYSFSARYDNPNGTY